MDKASLNTLFLAGLLHDIGKIRVPKTILNKPSELTPEKHGQIESHVTLGYRILEHIPFDGPMAERVRQRHERYGGSGSPRGLAIDRGRACARCVLHTGVRIGGQGIPVLDTRIVVFALAWAVIGFPVDTVPEMLRIAARWWTSPRPWPPGRTPNA